MSDDNIKQQISDAMEAHGEWKHRLRQAAAVGERGLPVDDICRDDRCKFGKWLYSVQPSAADTGFHGTAKELHAQFHKAAGDIAAMISRGEDQAAMSALTAGPFAETSAKLTRHLAQWKVQA